MPSVAPYIPPKDTDLLTWVNNFSSLITAAPATYGLSAGDAVNIATAIAPFVADMALIGSASTKTAAVVSQKNTDKVNMLNIVRPYAQQISNNPGVASADKIALGLNPKTSTPSPITPPDSNPVLTLLSQTPGVVNFRYRDSAASPSVKAKPFGVISCNLYGMASDTPITNPALLPNIATMTKSPYQWNAPDGYTPGKTWYFAATWQIRKGDESPFSTILSLIVP
jgi:hypothetical protein